MMGASSSSKGDGATVQNVLRFRCGVRTRRKTAFPAAARARAGVFCLRPYRAARTGGARGSSRIRSVMSAVRSTYGTVRIKLLVFSKTARGGRGGDARTGPCTPAHALQSARTGRALAASGISWTDGETSNTTPNVNLSPTPFRLLEGFTLRPCARSVRGQVAHRRVSAHDLR